MALAALCSCGQSASQFDFQKEFLAFQEWQKGVVAEYRTSAFYVKIQIFWP